MSHAIIYITDRNTIRSPYFSMKKDKLKVVFVYVVSEEFSVSKLGDDF